MKLFDLHEIPTKSPPLQNLQKQSVEMIIQICKNLQISLQAMHAALWVFHCNAIIMGYRRFDRFIYACGAVLVGSKLMQCLKCPTSILDNCRKILRRRKGLIEDVDSDEFLRKQVKNVFEAEVNILLNLGFDFQIDLALDEAERIKVFTNSPLQNFGTKYRQTLTSLYCTDVVIFFNPTIIACLALKILLKAQNRNVQTVQIDEELKQNMLSDEVKNAQKEYLMRCGFI